MAIVQPYTIEGTAIKTLTFNWISDAAGADSETTGRIVGLLLGVQFVPGTTTPSDLYDVTVTDSRGLDILCGLGANLSNSASKFYCPIILNGASGTLGSLVPVEGPLTLTVAAAGDSKTGTVVLFFK